MNRQTVRITVDIPVRLYRTLKIQAAVRGSSTSELILSGIQQTLSQAEGPGTNRVSFPLIVSDGPKVDLTSEQIYDHVEVP